MLAVAPFRDHAAALRSAGLGTIDRLSRATLEQLEGLGLSSATSVWLREVAVLARSARSWESLRPWHLAVATELADLGEIGVPPLWQGRTELVARLGGAPGELRVVTGDGHARRLAERARGGPGRAAARQPDHRVPHLVTPARRAGQLVVMVTLSKSM